MSNRAEQAMWAGKLQKALGAGYEIRFDLGDSGLTFCFYNGELYKQVPNEAMRGTINVYDYVYPHTHHKAR